MSRITGGFSVSRRMNTIHAPADLRQWGAREMARERQIPGLSPIPSCSRKGALAVTMPWARLLCAMQLAVQSATEQAYAW